MAIESKPLRKGLQQLCMMQPFWGTLALHMEFVAKPPDWDRWPKDPEDPDSTKGATLMTNGKQIFYNKTFTDSLSVGLCCFVIAHEVSHPFLHHLERPFKSHGRDKHTWGKTRDGKVWHYHPQVYNVAGDYVINMMLEDAGFQLWPKALKDPKFRGKTTEQVYWEILPPIQEQQQCSSCAGSGADPSMEETGGEACPDCEGSGEQTEGNGKSIGKLPSPDPITGHDLDPSQGPAEDFNQQEFNEIVTKAATIAKAQGKLPGSVAGMIKEATEPQYPVYMLLQNFIDSAILDDDMSFKKPHKHFMNQGIVMPSYYSERVSHVVLVYDTSGSVPDEDLGRFHRVGGDIIRRLKPMKLTVIQCDARVSDWIEVERDSDWPRSIKCTGRGGTSFRPPFAELRKRMIHPSCLVYLTDMYGDFPEPPPYPTLWISTSKGQHGPFGTTIYFNG